MILGKYETPSDIPPVVFCFPQGKQKTPSAIHNSNQSKIWIALGVFYFPWGKQKTPGGISSGAFYFPRIIKTPNNRIFISLWVINENTGNEYCLNIQKIPLTGPPWPFWASFLGQFLAKNILKGLESQIRPLFHKVLDTERES